MIRASTFAGKRVAVFGLGGSGLATARALAAGGANVAAWDDGASGRAAAETAGIPLADLSTTDWADIASLVLAPGVPLTHPAPHWVVLKARAANVEIIGDIEIFFCERAALAPASPVIAITGTNGKSTTTALIAHILRHAGRDVQMGGNIGVPVLDLEMPAPGRVHVLELSSFQIDLTPSLAPTLGVLLNITPDHIDRHGTFENYAAIKERLVSASVVASVGIDDDLTAAILKRKIASGAAVAFSARRAIAPGYSMTGTTLVCANRDGLAVRLGDLAGIATLRGRHNAQNALAAVSAVRECLGLVGESTDLDWQGALSSYPGLAHRLELIGTLARGPGQAGVLVVNDSKATNAESTDVALAAFPGAIHWILGGKPKEGGIATLSAHFPRIAKAYLIGAATEDFAASLEGHVTFERCGTLDVALAAAARDAVASDALEPVVLLSPACASYDQFRSFEHRGDTFRALAAGLPGFVAWSAR